MSAEIFERSVWQMSLGERAAVEGMLTQLRPALAIEIGSAEGACLRRIAAHAEEVHSFDLDPPNLPMPDNVTLHTGDSHQLLPAYLAELAEQDRNVDFVIVDGDHSSAGVRRDLEDLLDSRALAHTVILIHDTANERVRAGLDAVHFAAWPKVAHVELDCVPGHLFADPELRNELWQGLGLVLLDSSRLAYRDGSIYEPRHYPAAHLLAEMRELLLARELVAPGTQTLEDEAAALRRRVAELLTDVAASDTRAAKFEAEAATLGYRLDGAERALANIKGSASWRLTEPLRGAKRRVRGPKG